jgi:hypothetical protein
MNLRYRRYPTLGFGQSIPGDRIASQGSLLHGHKRGDQLQAVGDTVIDLAKKHLCPLPRLAHFPLGRFLLTSEAGGRKRLLGSRAEEIKENSTHILDDVIGSTCLEGGNGDPAFIGAGHIDYGRRIGELVNLREDVQSLLAWHEMIQGDHVEMLYGKLIQTFVAAQGVSDVKALT